MQTTLALLLVVPVAIIGAAGCQSSASGARSGSSAPPSLDAVLASAAGLSDRQVSEASQLYIAKCANCHKFYHPADYHETEWNRWMKKMGKKSKLLPDQYDLLSRYLAAFRNQNHGQKAASPR